MLNSMADLIRVEPIALLPTQAGCAVFLGDGTKVIVFYIDPAIGASINSVMSGEGAARPLTHDLFVSTLEVFGAKVSRAIIVKVENAVYYARIYLEAQNEVMEKKIAEIDCRPSDAIALTVRTSAPLYVLSSVWERLEDMSSTLEQMRDMEQSDDDNSD